jgi:hypothetical protein
MCPPGGPPATTSLLSGQRSTQRHRIPAAFGARCRTAPRRTGIRRTQVDEPFCAAFARVEAEGAGTAHPLNYHRPRIGDRIIFEHHAGTGSGVLVTVQQAGLALGVATLGTLYTALNSHGTAGAFAITTGIQVLIAAAIAIGARALPVPG